MSTGTAHRDLFLQLDSAVPRPGLCKMAAATATTQGTACVSEESIAGQDLTSSSAISRETVTVRTPQQVAPPPASTESLIGKSMGGPVLTPMHDLLVSPNPWEQEAHKIPLTSIDFPSMMTAFFKMLARGLSQTAAQITASIHADLQQVGLRIEVIVKKADQAVSRINQNSARIQDLQDQLESAFSKIDDLENRSRRYTFRIRGLPESVKAVHPAVY